MKCSEIMNLMEKLAPVRYACEWDNPGLLAGRSDKEVTSVMIALDLTDQVLEEMIDNRIDLLITHHPLIFKSLKQVNDMNFISKRILTLIQQDISYYVSHTNFDIAPGCMADLAADRINLGNRSVLEPMIQQQENSLGIGRIGSLENEHSLMQLGELVKHQFDLPYVMIYGTDRIRQPIQTVAISPGAGSSIVDCAIRQKAQVLITGDISHHTGIDAVSQGMAIIDAGHYGLEHIFIDFMEQYLKQEANGQITIYKEKPAFPAVAIF